MRCDVPHAHLYTRAVLATLFGAVPDDQFFGVVVHLPDDYASVLTP